jgi:CRISPR-associated protein Cst2
MNKGLTVTIIVEAQSLNYDEGFGSNLSVLKKLRRGSGDVFSFASRQSLRYSIVKQGVEQFGWRLGDVEPQGSGNKKVVQFKRDTSIKDSEEIDLFGYMKTKKREKKKKETDAGEASQQEDTMIRVAPVRLTPAISLEAFYNDIEFLNNKWLSDRAGEDPNIANIEQHRSLYKYTITIDLNRIGSEEHNETLDPKDRIKLLDQPEERANRVNEFLEVLKNLYRDIRGRREDLKPLFIIGGVYPVKNPFFMNSVKIEWENGKPKIVKEAIDEILSSNYCYKDNDKLNKEQVQTNTVIGLRNGFFSNGTSLSNVFSPETAIDTLKLKVNDFYGVK